MRKPLLLLTLIFFAAGYVFAQTPVQPVAQTSTTTPAPDIVWAANTYDFGTVHQGTPVSHSFEFTNTSGQALKIESVKASCGCTATDYSKAEIAPGQKGYVTATYNAAKVGYFTKTVSVKVQGSDQPIVLKLRGKVQSEG